MIYLFVEILMRLPCLSTPSILPIQKLIVPLPLNKANLIQTYLFQKRYAYLKVGNVGNSRLKREESIVVSHAWRGLLFSYSLF